MAVMFFIALDGIRSVYQWHAMYLPAGRGKEAFRATRECFDYLFTRGASLITANEQASNPLSKTAAYLWLADCRRLPTGYIRSIPFVVPDENLRGCRLLPTRGFELWVFLADLASSIIGGNAQKDAAKSTAATALTMYNQNQANLNPYIQAGTSASGTVQALLGLGGDQAGASKAFQNYLGSTGYQNTLNTGTQAVQQGAAAQGGLYSGAAGKALTAYGQQLGQQTFQTYLGDVNNVAAQGLSGASALAGAGQNYVNTINSTNNQKADATQGMWQDIDTSFQKTLGGSGGGSNFGMFLSGLGM
jgi:hypothetical protein